MIDVDETQSLQSSSESVYGDRMMENASAFTFFLIHRLTSFQLPVYLLPHSPHPFVCTTLSS